MYQEHQLTSQMTPPPLPLPPVSSGPISDWRMRVPSLYPSDSHSSSATPIVTPGAIPPYPPNIPQPNEPSSSKSAQIQQQPIIPRSQIASTSSLELVNSSDTDRGDGQMEVDGEESIEDKPKSERRERRKEQNRAAQRVFRAKAKIQTQEVSQD